jgi:hypothetical protein
MTKSEKKKSSKKRNAGSCPRTTLLRRLRHRRDERQSCAALGFSPFSRKGTAKAKTSLAGLRPRTALFPKSNSNSKNKSAPVFLGLSPQTPSREGIGMEQNVPKTKPRSLRGLAKKERVSHTTMRRTRQFARAVDTIAASVGEDPMTLLAGDVKIGRRDWQTLAEIATVQPQAAKNVLARIRTAATMKAGNQIVRQAYEAVFGTKCSTGPSAFDQILTLIPKLTPEERATLMDLLRSAGCRFVPDDQAELFCRSLRELIRNRREEINARTPRRYRLAETDNREQLQWLEDVEKELDLTTHGSAA